MTRAITLLCICLGVLLPLIAARSIKPLCLEGGEYESCTPTCHNLKPDCPKESSPGCVCGSGTVDSGLGECVEIVKCDFCSGNTTYISCGSDCPPQPNPNIPVKCLAVCVEKCVCKHGYVSLPNSDRCVLPRDLP
ncbi:venom peptide SjAPI-like [Bufo bufo]|uniref:venom peptide SjAPI-like n=1 Tax=Bufo bufo TaxID=8384 RepID=UPI001ABE876D|nr:venom peptide SjAPI-like [Bufo bufo]